MDLVAMRHRLHDEKLKLAYIRDLAAAPTVQGFAARSKVFATTGALYARALTNRPARQAVVLHLGNWGDFWVRDFTEVAVLWQIFIDDCYGHPGLPDNARTIVDLGCNVGASLVWLFRRYPEATIIGIEADPQTAALAVRNTASIPGITVEHAAISGETGMVTLFRQSQQSWSTSMARTDGEPFTVPAVSLDDLMDQYGLDRIDLLKIDVEGAEHATLEAATRLDDVGVIIGEFHPVPDRDWATFRKTLGAFEVEQLAEYSELIDFIALPR